MLRWIQHDFFKLKQHLFTVSQRRVEKLVRMPGRLALIPGTGAWVVYTVNKEGVPKVQASKPGFEGFAEIVLLFSKGIKV